ncbi:Cytochrome P450 CYP749A22, partial [Linum perenne]
GSLAAGNPSLFNLSPGLGHVPEHHAAEANPAPKEVQCERNQWPCLQILLRECQRDSQDEDGGFSKSHVKSIPQHFPQVAASLARIWTEKYGKSFVFWMGPEPMLLISEPELVRVVLNETGKDFQKMELHKHLELAAKNIFKITIPGLRSRLKDEIEEEQLEQVIRDLIIEMIRKRKEMVIIHGGGEEEEDSYGSDFLGLLLKAHHEAYESKKITVDDVVDECKTFYLAGQESCNILLSWVMLLLSIHTDWQEEARKEVDAIFGFETPNPDGISKPKT